MQNIAKKGDADSLRLLSGQVQAGKTEKVLKVFREAPFPTLQELREVTFGNLARFRE